MIPVPQFVVLESIGSVKRFSIYQKPQRIGYRNRIVDNSEGIIADRKFSIPQHFTGVIGETGAYRKELIVVTNFKWITRSLDYGTKFHK